MKDSMQDKSREMLHVVTRAQLVRLRSRDLCWHFFFTFHNQLMRRPKKAGSPASFTNSFPPPYINLVDISFHE